MTTLNRYALQLALITAGLGLFALWPSLPSAQGQVDPDTIVLYASEAPRRQGAFHIVQDSSAAGGKALGNPNEALPLVTAPLANPPTYAELTFTAEAGRPYHLWMRARAAANSPNGDSVWMQFSGTVNGLNGPPALRIGTTAGVWLSLEEASGAGLDGWGWADNGYGMNVFGADLWFATTGTQTVRLQPREDGIIIDQIVLSGSRYLATPPGASKNSPTILPANSDGTGGGAPPPPPTTTLCGTLPPNALPALAWNASQGATGYTVHYGTASGQVHGHGRCRECASVECSGPPRVVHQRSGLQQQWGQRLCTGGEYERPVGAAAQGLSPS